MAQNLRDNYRTPSLGGITFLEVSAEFETGQRHDVHEYAQRDVPYTEPLGRRARRINVDGRFIGQNHVDQSNQFRKVIESKKYLNLITRALGEHKVLCDTCTLTFTEEAEGVTEFSAQFVEAGKFLFASASQNIPSALITTIDQSNLGIAAQFASVNLNTSTTIVGDVGDEFTSMLSGRVIAGQETNSLRIEADGLSRNTAAYANKGDDFLTLTGNWFRDFGLLSTSPETGQEALIAWHDWGSQYVQGPAFTTATQQLDELQANLNLALRAQALSEAMRLGVLVEYQNRRVAIESMEDLLGKVDAVLADACNTFQDQIYTGLLKSRNLYLSIMNESLVKLPQLFCYTYKRPMPVLVVAYDIYGNCDRVDELMSLNPDAHPLAMPLNVTALQ